MNIAACTDEAAECRKLYAADQQSEAIPFCEKACNQNDGEACFFLGLFYSSGVIQDATQRLKNYLKAKTYLEKACDLNNGYGCILLGELYDNGQGVRQDDQMAKAYYEKACDQNNGSGCFRLARHYERGHVLKNSQTAKGYAKEYYGKACYLGDKNGCEDYQKLDKKGY